MKLKSFFGRAINRSTIFALFLAILPITAGQMAIAPPAKAATACAANDTSGNISGTNYAVTPSHGQVFYIDTGVNPRIDAAYIGYSVKSSAAKTDIWVKLSSFTGSQVALANPNDSQQQISSINAGSSKTAFFLMKATGTTSSNAQTHLVEVYEGNPNRGGSVKYSCTFTFSNIKETIKASANKVQTISVSPSSPTLGSTFTITVTGTMGNPGNGSSPDGSIIWATPSAYSTWPTSALRLETTSLTLDQDGDFTGTTNDQNVYTDQLIVSGLATMKPGTANRQFGNNSQYKGVYTFRVIGSTNSNVKVAPVSQISSGNQYKHSDTTSIAGGSAFPTLNLSNVASTMTVTKKISPTGRVTNAFLTSNEATLTTQEAHGLATGDWIYVTDLSAPYNGSFQITRLSTTTFKYSVSNANIASASVSGFIYKKVGTDAIIPYEVVVTSSGSTSIDEIVDIPDSGLSYVSGSVETKENGAISFSLGSNPVLDSTESSLSPRPYHFVGPFTSTSSNSFYLRYKMTVSTTATGSFSNTLYAKSGNQIVGASASTNPKIVISTSSSGVASTSETNANADPTVQTLPVTALSTTSATLAGNVDSNGNTSNIKFQYGTDSTLSSNTLVNSSPSSSSSSDPISISSNISGLLANTTYYYRAYITYTPSGGSSTNIYGEILSFKTNSQGGTSQTLTWGTTYATTDLATTTSNTQNTTLNTAGTLYTGGDVYASSGLLVDITSSTPAVCTVSSAVTTSGGAETGVAFTISYLTTGTCTLTASQNGDATYAAATSITKSFAIKKKFTITYNGNGNTSNASTVPNPQTQSGFDASITIATPGATFVKTGATFVKWNTSSNGSGTAISAGATYTPTADITLYAQWSDATYTISYDGNSNDSGTVPGSSNKSYNTTYTVLGNTGSLSRTGYSFNNWNTSADGSGTPYSSGNTFSVLGSVTLYAQWSANTLQVTYNSQGGTSISNGSTTTGASIASSPGSPTRDGYIFDGWFVESTGGTALEFPYLHGRTSDFTLYAQWSAASYGVVVNNNTGGTASGSSTSVPYNGSVTLTATPSSGYAFVSWSCTGGTLSSSTTNPATLSAITSSTNCTPTFIATYSVTISNPASGGTGATSATTVNSGSSVTLSTSPASGYEFSSWTCTPTGSRTLSLPNSSTTSVTNITGNITCSPSFTINAYAITVNNNTGGTASSSSANVNHGGSVTLTAVASTGYHFSNWSCTNGTLNTSTSNPSTLSGITSASTCTPTFEADVLIVTFDAQGGSGAASSANTVTGGSVASDPGSPTKSGYSFNGWYDDPSAGNRITFAYVHGRSANFSIYAHWTGNKYSYNANGGSNAPADQTYAGTAITSHSGGSLGVPTGHTFDGWCTTAVALDGTCSTSYAAGTELPTPGSSNVTLYAKWKAITYTITYDPGVNGAGSVVIASYKYGGAAHSIKAQSDVTGITRAGYTLSSWSTTNSSSAVSTHAFGDSYSSAADLTLYPIWTANNYRVTYYDNVAGEDISVPTDNTNYNIGNTLTVSNTPLTRNGYTFAGWTEDSGNSGTVHVGNGHITVATSNISLYAKWNSNKYSYDPNTGTSAPNDQSFSGSTIKAASGSSMGAPAGKQFVGWCTTATTPGSACPVTSTQYLDNADLPTPSTSTVTLYAVWEKIQYRVTYHTDGADNPEAGVPTDSNVYFYNDSVTVLSNVTNLTKSGHNFSGWNTGTNGSGTDRNSGSQFATTGHVHLYPHWTVIGAKSVTFHINDGGVDQTSSQTDTTTATLQINPFIREGYTFNGWNTASNGNGNAYGASQQHDFATDLVLYAQWSINSYSFTYDSNGGTFTGGGTTNSISLAYDSDAISQANKNPSRSGYKFVGWGVSSASTSKENNYRVPANSSAKLYAIWSSKNSRNLNINANKTSLTDWSDSSTVTVTATTDNSTDSDGSRTYSLDTGSTGCTVNSSTGEITVTGFGTCKVKSFISEGNENNSASSTTVSISIPKKSATITAVDKSFNYGGSATPSASHNLHSSDLLSSAVYEYVNDGSKAPTWNSTTMPTEPGEYIITPSSASVTGSHSASDYNISYASGRLVINKAPRTLTINSSSYPNSEVDWSHSALILSSTASGDDTIDTVRTYSLVSGAGVCSVASNGTVTFAGPGTCKFKADIAAGSRYLEASANEITVTVGKRNQNISHPDSSLNLAAGEFTPSPSNDADSNTTNLNDYVYTIDTSGGKANTATCSISGGRVLFTAAGECYVGISENGNSHWNSATKTFKLTVNGKNSRGIGIRSSSYSATYTDWSAAGPTLTSEATYDDNDGTKTYSLATGSTGCEVNSTTGKVTFTGASGTSGCKIKVTITEGTNYNSATSTEISITVGKRNQTISLTQPSAMTVGDSDQSITTSTDATGLSPTATVDASSSGICEIVGGKIRAIAAGTCKINSSHPGNDNWNPGAQVQKSFVISARATTPAPTPTPDPEPVNQPSNNNNGNGNNNTTPTTPPTPTTPVEPTNPGNGNNNGNNGNGNGNNNTTPTTPVTPVEKPKLIEPPVAPKNEPPVVVTPPVIAPPATPVVAPTAPVFQPVAAPTRTAPTVTAAPAEVITVKQITVPVPSNNGNANAPVAQGVQISGNDWSIAITSTKTVQQGQVNEAAANIQIEVGNTVTTFGTGFKPKSQVDVYVFSTPTWLGSVMTDENGNYTVTLPMPASLPVGDHVFQAQGITFDNIERTANVPITLIPAAAKPTGKRSFEVFYAMDSFALDAKGLATIKAAYNAVKAKLTSKSVVTVEVVGWVQPTKNSPNVNLLSQGRAKAVVKALKKLGLKANYVIKAPGHDKRNIPQSRRASTVITWTNSK